MCSGVGIHADQQSNFYKTLTSKDYFTKMNKDEKIRVMVFTLTECIPCGKAKATIIPGLTKKYAANANVEVYTVDSDNDVAYNGKSLTNSFAYVSNSRPLFTVVYHNDVMFFHGGFSLKEISTLENEIDAAIKNIH